MSCVRYKAISQMQSGLTPFFRKQMVSPVRVIPKFLSWIVTHQDTNSYKIHTSHNITLYVLKRFERKFGSANWHLRNFQNLKFLIFLQIRIHNLLLLLLLLLLLSLSALYRVFTSMSPTQTMSLGDTLLQLLFRFIVSTLYGAYLPRSYVGSDSLLRQHFPEKVSSA